MFKLTNFRSDGAFWPLAERADFPGAAQSQPATAALLTAPWRLMKAIAAELAARRAMQSLASLDERMLRDIGIERDEIWHAARHGREALARSNGLGADILRWS